jgi:inner membrane protein
VPLALTLTTGSQVSSARLTTLGVLCSALPDVDSLGFWAGVPYASFFGHRGFTHSLFFAAMVGLLASAAARPLHAHAAWAFAFITVSTASHGLLDTFTNGGLGVALLSPFSNQRFFAPWRPIPVSPIGVHGLASGRGLSLFTAELLLVWLPCLAVGGAAYLLRTIHKSS